MGVVEMSPLPTLLSRGTRSGGGGSPPGTFAIRGGVIILPVHVVVDIVPIDVVAIARVVERRRSAARRAIDRDGPVDGGGGGDGRCRDARPLHPRRRGRSEEVGRRRGQVHPGRGRRGRMGRRGGGSFHGLVVRRVGRVGRLLLRPRGFGMRGQGGGTELSRRCRRRRSSSQILLLHLPPPIRPRSMILRRQHRTRRGGGGEGGGAKQREKMARGDEEEGGVLTLKGSSGSSGSRGRGSGVVLFSCGFSCVDVAFGFVRLS